DWSAIFLASVARWGSCPACIAARTAAGCTCSSARAALAQSASTTGNRRASSRAAMKGGRWALDTNRIGPAWDIANSDHATDAAQSSSVALMLRQWMGRNQVYTL